MFPLYHFPELPSSKSLLIKGEYHPSAPIHFCISHLSHANDESVAVFITPSKESFVQTLVAYNDRWLGKYGGSGEVAAKLSRVKVFYPSTVRQLAFLLSMLHCPSSTTPELDARLVLSAPPTFIILHEVSSLFAGPELEATCPDYLRVVAQATDIANSLSDAPERNVNLVWFDSKLQDLMLPALPRPNYINEADEKYYEPISVGKMAEKYFEWVGDVSVGEESHLEVRVRGPGNTETSWKWGGVQE